MSPNPPMSKPPKPPAGPANGPPPRCDKLLAVEGVTGSAAADVLVGDDAANFFDGSAGDDRVEGRGGDDQLTDGRGVDSVHGEAGDDLVSASGPGDFASGGPGADWVAGGLGASAIRLDGGPGADRISFFDRPRAVSCGEGSDVVASNQFAGLRLDGCEEVRLGAFDLFEAFVKPIRRSRRTLGLRVKCRARGSTPIRRCRGTVTLRLRRRGARPLTLGRRKFSIAEAHSGEVRVRVRRHARRRLRAASRPLIEITVRGKGAPKMHGPGGVDVTPSFAGTWRVRLPRSGG